MQLKTRLESYLQLWKPIVSFGYVAFLGLHSGEYKATAHLSLTRNVAQKEMRRCIDAFLLKPKGR